LPKVKPKLSSPQVDAPPTPPATVSGRRPQRTLQIAFAVTAFVLLLFVIYLLRGVLGAFVLGTLLAFLINPAVDRLELYRVPRAVSILGIFALLGGIAAALISMFMPLLTTEIEQLQAAAPALAASAQNQLNDLQGQQVRIFGIPLDLSALANRIDNSANQVLLGQFGNALSLGVAAITTLFQLILMLIIAFLIALDAHEISSVVRRLVPIQYRSDFDSVWAQLKSMLLAYFRGQLIIAALIGVVSGLACWLLGLPYALALGLLAALTSLVPYLGPFLGAVPAILVGLSVSPFKALLVAAVYFVISNVILNFVYPKVVGEAVRLPALLVIVAFIAGFGLAGILGMFIAVPIAATLRILFDYLYPRLYGI
jgi:predicted PurR-regulated permease PerM